ncbi:MAG: C25 family cysteine peptidase [Patescibacteria group bacterium]|nr:C25 family cysteine peptidase [Patescibacteria group bacterium]
MFNNKLYYCLVLCLTGLALAVTGCAVAAETSAPRENLEEATSDICAAVPSTNYPAAVKCEPGSVLQRMYCANGGLTGTRECLSDGAHLGPTVCPRGGQGVNGQTNYLIVTRSWLRNQPGFNSLVGAVARGLNYQISVVDAEELVWAFPQPTIPESIRAGLQHLKSNEMPGLRYVTLVGKPDPARRGQNVTWFTQQWEIPLWYHAPPPGTAVWDMTDEQMVPARLFYGYLRGPWPRDLGGRFWTPEIFIPDVHIGQLQVNGDPIACGDPNGCPTDLQMIAQKLSSWKPGSSFVESQFHGSQCAGEKWYDLSKENAALDGVAMTVDYHNCAGGETGDMAQFAKAAEADYLFFAYHGAPSGSGYWDSRGNLAGYLYDAATPFPGMVFAYSCSTGSPDQSNTALGEAQLENPDGAVAFMGYDRILSGALVEPMARAFSAGRWTIGEAMDGMIWDLTHGLTWQSEVKAMVSLMGYMDPAMPIADPPRASVRSMASRTLPDGGMDACLYVSSKDATESSVLIGDRVVADVKLNAGATQALRVSFTADEVAAGSVAHLASCNPTAGPCQVSLPTPEPAVRLDCGKIEPNVDGSFSVDVTADFGKGGQGMSFEVVSVAFECPEGRRSDCYLQVRGSDRRERVIASMPVERLEPGVNRVTPFQIERPTGQDELFRAMLVRLRSGAGQPAKKDAATGELKAGTGNVLGECYVPFEDDLEVEELGLL